MNIFVVNHTSAQTPDTNTTSHAPDLTTSPEQTSAAFQYNESVLAHTALPDNAMPWTGEPLSSYPAGTEASWAGWAPAPPAAAGAATNAGAATTAATAVAAQQQLAGGASVIEQFHPLVTSDAADPLGAFSSPGDACCDPWCTAYCRGAYAAVADHAHHPAAALAAAAGAPGAAPGAHATVVVNEVSLDCPGTAQVGNVSINCQARSCGGEGGGGK